MELFSPSTPGGFVMILLFLLGLVLYFMIAERFVSRAMASNKSNITSGMRRAGIIRALIALAPMLGLLGTVCGMIHTFQVLSFASSSEWIAEGIHAALYTTEYGLAIAIPAFILERFILDDNDIRALKEA